VPKSKKLTHTTDDSKLRDVEAYTHDNVKRANNPPAGMARYYTKNHARRIYGS